MASDYPASIDAFPDPLVNSPLNSPSHAALHQDVNDAVEKIEVKLGVGVSPASGASAGQVLMSSGSGNTGWSNVSPADIDSIGQPAQNVLVSDGAGSAAWSSSASGLWLVKTQTVGAGVGSVTVTNAFSADYQNYRISWTGGTMSTANDISFQLSGLTANGYFGSSYFNAYSGGATGINNFNNLSSWQRIAGGNSTSAMLSMDIFRPAVAAQTTMTFIGFSGDLFTIFGSGIQTAATAATGFILTPVAGTLSGGVVRVYGYRD